VRAARALKDLGGRARAVELDTFRTAVGLAVIAGGLALEFPFFNALAAALVALGGAGWMAARSRPSGPLSSTLALGWAVVATGVVAYFALPSPWDGGRGLALAASFLPLWFAERAARGSRSGEGAR